MHECLQEFLSDTAFVIEGPSQPRKTIAADSVKKQATVFVIFRDDRNQIRNIRRTVADFGIVVYFDMNDVMRL
jgi:hypothetical protein